MGFSSDQASLVNQVVTSANLPGISKGVLFENRLEYILGRMANIINSKEGGLYSLSEFLCFKQVFITSDPQTFSNVYRKSFDLVDLNGGNIAGGATVNFAHNISDIDRPIMIYASCRTTDPEYFMVVHPDVLLTATNINFTNPHASAVNEVMAVCEYTKS